MAEDFDSKLRPHLETLLEPGETLEGICAASRQKGMFSGDSVALGITSARLLIQPLSRRGEPDGEAIRLAPADLADVKAEGAGGGWAQVGAALMDEHAVKLELKTTAGDKQKLMFMRAEGGGLMAKLGGGEGQARGVAALAAWFSRAEGA